MDQAPMPATAFGLVLFAALLHASWNAIVKAAADKRAMTAVVTGVSALLAAAALPFLPQPAPASWPFIAASSGLQIVYFRLVARAYEVTDMSRAYPLMRGAAPLLVSAAAVLWIGESLPAMAWAGVGLICAGVLSLTGASPDRRGTALALANAVVIAAYTLVDGVGVRRSGTPAAYTLWIFLLTGAPMTLAALARSRPAFLACLRTDWPRGLAGGAGTLVSYGLALWAMTLAPVTLVAALRESSILFAMAISALLLGERPGWPRIAAGCLIAGGAMALRLS